MHYDRVQWLRTRTLDAHLAMATEPAPVLDASAFGNTSGGAVCATVWADVVDQAGTAHPYLREAVQTDAVRLDEVIACFQRTDHESADDLCAAGSTITVMSAHLHSHDSDQATPEWDDYLRATQHDRMVDYAVGRPGAVIVGVDANVSVDRDDDGGLAEYPQDLAPRAVDRFDQEGFDNVGDFSEGQPGEGTSSSDRSIDYVWVRGLNAGAPTEVEGDPSDHDGQYVEYALPRW
jgi:hypothetical protein